MNITNTLNSSLSYLSSSITNMLPDGHMVLQDLYSRFVSSGEAIKVQEESSKQAIQKSFSKIKKFYVDYSWGPNFLQCILSPYEFFHSYSSLNSAMKYKSKESILDNRLRLVTISVNSTYSAATILATISQLGLWLGRGLQKVSSIAPIVGIATAFVCGVIECKNVRRQLRFLTKCEKTLELLEKSESCGNGLVFLNKYLGDLSQNADLGKLTKLANRVKPWFAEKMALELPALVKGMEQTKDLNLRKESLQKTIELIRNARIQAQKKLIHQSFTLASSALLITGFALVLLAQAYLIPVVIFAINLSLMATNHFTYLSTRNQIGWKFKAMDCVPSWMISVSNRIQRCFSKDLEVATAKHP